MIVPQLDRQVFTPGAPRDYVSHALAIAQQFPDYGKMLQQGIRAEQERQALALKYQTDLQKAQEFLDLYPPYRDAQTAILRAPAASTPAGPDSSFLQSPKALSFQIRLVVERNQRRLRLLLPPMTPAVGRTRIKSHWAALLSRAPKR